MNQFRHVLRRMEIKRSPVRLRTAQQAFLAPFDIENRQSLLVAGESLTIRCVFTVRLLSQNVEKST